MKNEFLKNPCGPVVYSHAATITEYEGQLYMSWYVYEDKENEKGQIVYCKYDKATNEWAKSIIAFPSLGGSSQGNPVLFTFNNKLHLFFVILKRHYWNSSEIYSSSFDSKSSSWSIPQKINTPEGIMVRHRPMLIGNQAIIPAYDENTMTTILYSFQNNISIWTEYSRITESCIQGDLFSFNEQECQMYLRSTNESRKILKSVSANAGKQWEATRMTKLHCPLSGIAAIALKSGKILIANNQTELHKRNPISLSLSDSKGLDFDLGTWHVDKTNIELSYPTLFQDSEEVIHLAFTFNRKMIKHISFTEGELISQLETV